MSGYLGVSKNTNSRKFSARINVNGRQVHIGTFDTAEQAHSAYVIAKRSYHEDAFLAQCAQYQRDAIAGAQSEEAFEANKREYSK